MEKQSDIRAGDSCGRNGHRHMGGMLRRTMLTTTLIALTSICSARAQEINSASAKETLSNIYLTAFGSRGGRGPVSQTELDLNLGSHISPYVWVDYDFGDRTVHEVDFSYMIGGKLLRVAKAPEMGEVSGSAGIQVFAFPSKKLYDRTVYCLAAQLSCDWPLNGSITAWHLAGGKQRISGNFGVLNLSEEAVSYSVLGKRLLVSPTLKTAYGNRFLGFNGLLYLAPGVKLQYGNVEVFSRFQRGIGNVKNEMCIGVSVRVGR